MTDFILNPFTIISALIAVAVLIFGCGKWVGRVNSEQQAIRDSFEDVKGWIDEIRKDVGTLREGVAKLIGRLEARPTVESGSPAAPNGLRRGVSRKSRCQEMGRGRGSSNAPRRQGHAAV